MTVGGHGIRGPLAGSKAARHDRRMNMYTDSPEPPEIDEVYRLLSSVNGICLFFGGLKWDLETPS